MEKPEKKDLIKISDYIWEIPKSFREDPPRPEASMKVPARVFADEKMLDEILEDKSLWQLVNVASLPGIYKYALAMPDAHEGYGACVGSVAAFDYDEGIISPGICGYDINCLHPETKVNLDFGTYLEIKDLAENKDIQVISYDKKEAKLIQSKLVFFLKKKAEKIIEIKTKFGYQILLTEDHPVFTSGFKKKLAKNLKPGDSIFIYPFTGVKYEKPERILIMDEKQFERFLKQTGILQKQMSIDRYINFLKQAGFLPLYLDSPVMPYLIKILGYSIGKSSFLIQKAKKVGQGPTFACHFYDKLQNLLEVAEDLKKIHINFAIKKKQVYALNLIDRPFVMLLIALGVPFGYKCEFEFKIPKWLFQAPKFYQRLFLASLFGSQGLLSIAKGKTYPAPFIFSLNVKIEKINEALNFLKDLKRMLEESFQIKTLKHRVSLPSGIKGKTAGVFFYVSSEPKNLIKFLETINFEYNPKKRSLALALATYLRYKLKVIEHRNKVLEEARMYKKRGYSLKMIKELFVDKENYIDEEMLKQIGRKKIVLEIPRYFIRFHAFQEKYLFNNLISDEVEEINVHKYKGDVFDITVEDKSHNFFANNVLVSNCGVRLIASDLNYEEVKDKIPKLTEEIFKQVPSGVGKGGFWKLNNDEMRKVLENGAKYIYELGYGEKEDLETTESFGRLEDADADAVSQTAKDRGKDQLGTIGAGNHFIEIQRISEIYDDADYADFTQTKQNDISAKSAIAKKLGLEKNKICVLIHCGSRGLGHQVCTDYVREFLRELDRKGIDLIDRELAYSDFHSDLGQRYFKAMNCSANFAWANRQLILHQIRKAFKKIFGKEIKLRQVYDVAHNIVKIEEYEGKKLIVHRKGATRAFWKGHPELPEKYREIGQPILIPGSMGTSSYILIGQELAKEISFGSAPHGAGRLMSRAEAKRKVKGSELKKELEKRGISVAAGSISGLAEEAPVAYKDVSEVVEVVHNIGIAKKLAKLVPVGVIKG
jgi:tRNA-splicing ligase RtcB